MRAPIVDVGNATPGIPFADPAPELNPDLDGRVLAHEFRKSGRIHIPNVLTEASARRVFHALEHETPWSVLFNEGNEHLEIARIPPGEQQKLTLAAWDRARSGFQFLYRHHRLSDNREPYPKPGHYLGKIAEFLTSRELMGFIREVTGEDAVVWASAHATLYMPLDFLTIHDDNIPENDRRVAYVLNMTPNWRPDWGGALQFFDRPDHIEEAYLPAFNALNLFRVPKLHSVAQVAPFGGMRYAVSGWFHAGKPGENVALSRS